LENWNILSVATEILPPENVGFLVGQSPVFPCVHKLKTGHTKPKTVVGKIRYKLKTADT
jgi:hypothetical protein